jgi:hypothetical protein
MREKNRVETTPDEWINWLKTGVGERGTSVAQAEGQRMEGQQGEKQHTGRQQ